MAAVTLILVLLGAAAALHVAAGRLHVPHPVLLVVGGLGLALMPGLPQARLDPDVIFLIFVPPLVYRAALLTSWRDFREYLRSILLLAVGLVVVTIAVIAFVAHAILPALPVTAAILLGAIVAPSDPVSATAALRGLDTPRPIDTILAGEGLVNDATALVAYKMAVNAVTSGSFPPFGTTILRLAVVGAGGVAVGLAVGVAVAWIRRQLQHVPEVENTISLLTPFVAYIPADRLGLSGVLAVVAVGLYMGRGAPRIVSAETRLQNAGMWEMMTFVLEGLIFILIGLEMPVVTSNLSAPMEHALIKAALLISAVTIGVRLLWVFPGTYLPRRFSAWRGAKPEYPPWQNVFFVGWAGMRGADSLVIALALPLMTAGGLAFPARDTIVFVTFTVILLTLVVQGLTLRPLIRLLGIEQLTPSQEEREERVARERIEKAGVAKLDQIIRRRPTLAKAARHLRAHHVRPFHDEEEAASRVRADMITAERRELVRLRDHGVIGDDVMRNIQRDLDLEQMLVGASDETLE